MLLDSNSVYSDQILDFPDWVFPAPPLNQGLNQDQNTPKEIIIIQGTTTRTVSMTGRVNDPGDGSPY